MRFKELESTEASGDLAPERIRTGVLFLDVLEEPVGVDSGRVPPMAITPPKDEADID